MAVIIPGDGIENVDIWINLGWQFVSNTESDGQGIQREIIEITGKDG